MKKLILVLLSVSATSALAAEGIRYTVSSGLQAPGAWPFKIACTITPNSVDYTKTSYAPGGFGTSIQKSTSSYSGSHFKKLMKLLEKASKSDATRAPAPCDIGSSSIVGEVDGKEFPIRVVSDCDSTITNSSAEATQIVTAVGNICKPGSDAQL